MNKGFEIIKLLTAKSLPSNERSRALKDFAEVLGWRPSDRLEDYPIDEKLTTGHLVVEHGLDNTAVISFLKSPVTIGDITIEDRNRLLGISYNNLVDWQIFVETNAVSFIFNRVDPLVIDTQPISHADYLKLRSEAFDQITGKKPTPNLPSLDKALIDTISYWRRLLDAELRPSLSNEHLSAFFNAIFFVRAIEDDKRRFKYSTDRTLLDVIANKDISLRDAIISSLRKLGITSKPSTLIDFDRLQVFDALSRETIQGIFTDFYKNKFAPYEYDFSLMSKHALSRIYENYASLLIIEDTPQATLFSKLPEEERNKAYGSVYTPQFIARFFVRYLRENIPLSKFRHLKAIDPACGSGIFLRTLLEMQCDPLQDVINTQALLDAFKNVTGLDADENACQATRLSLALLHLVLTRKLPKHLNILKVEAIEYFQKHTDMKVSFDAVIANPPFIALGTQSSSLKKRIKEFMGDYAKGRIDTYLAFLQIGLEMVKPGGFVLYVLPHSFLIGKNAQKLRERISKEFWVHCLADLSAIRVFGDIGSYVILLILQKKLKDTEEPFPATIIKCQDFVGHALQDCLEGKRLKTNFYSIYDVDQLVFAQSEWIVFHQEGLFLHRKLEQLQRLENFFIIREGFISGADDVFIINQKRIPKKEEELYVPFLPDRQMERYIVPESTEFAVFYPFEGTRKLTSEEIEQRFPKTWSYLLSKKEQLQERKPVQKGEINWWEPTRPRLPENMMRPKIISPHLVLLPRFSVDLTGKYAISRSPLLYPKSAGTESDFLKFFVAIMNSSVVYWYISSHAHKYSRGYVMLEPKTLKSIPIPDPAGVPSNIKRKLLSLIEKRTAKATAPDIEREIDLLVAQIYSLSTDELKEIGMGED